MEFRSLLGAKMLPVNQDYAWVGIVTTHDLRSVEALSK